MLPKGRLFSSRRYGQYGNYVTWKLLKTLALLYQIDSSTRLPWTAKRLAEEAGMSYQGMLRLLERAKDKGWTKYDKDALGRKAWVITADGAATLNKELHRRMVFEVSKKKTLAETTIKIVDRGIRALTALKAAGFTDIQARESLINYNIKRIEWAISASERTVVVKAGAYIWALIKYGDRQERRSRIYLERAYPGFSEEIRTSIVKEALRTTKVFRSTLCIASNLRGWNGKKHGTETLYDVGEACIRCSKMGLIKLKPVYYFTEAAWSHVA